ncbi:MAG: nucleotidyltransferase [Acidimicrobiales bacterium]
MPLSLSWKASDLERQEIESALEELGSELEKRGIRDARLLLVGGAVMVMDFGAREMTDDVDGGVYPAKVVLEVAAEIGERRGWDPKWLNDAAKIYIPDFKRPDWKSIKKVGTLEIFTADARAMLAMKMRASRGARDEIDLTVLLSECGIASAEEAVSLYEEYFPEDPLPAQAVPMIRFALEHSK